MNQLNLREILSFMRFPNLIIIFLCMWLVRLRMIQPFLELNGQALTMSQINFHLYVLDVLLVALLGYWINDWNDRNVDAINAPNRFLVKHEVSKQRFQILMLAVLVSTSALTMYLAIVTKNIKHVWILPVCVGLLFAYAKTFNRKGLVGNLMVSALIASLPLMAFLSESDIINRSDTNSEYLWASLAQFSLLIFFSNFARELTKDIADVRGDAVVTSRSLPLTIGIQKTKYIVASALVLIAAVEVCVLQIENITATSYLGFLVIIAIGVLLWFLFSKRFKPETLSIGLKLLMVLGLFQICFVY